MNWLSVRGWAELAGFSEEDRRLVVREAARELRRCRPALAWCLWTLFGFGMLLTFFAEVLVPNEAPRYSPAWTERMLLAGITFPPFGAIVFGVVAHVIYLRCLRPCVVKVIERAVETELKKWTFVGLGCRLRDISYGSWDTFNCRFGFPSPPQVSSPLNDVRFAKSGRIANYKLQISEGRRFQSWVEGGVMSFVSH
jgi:hypothetical protein